MQRPVSSSALRLWQGEGYPEARPARFLWTAAWIVATLLVFWLDYSVPSVDLYVLNAIIVVVCGLYLGKADAIGVAVLSSVLNVFTNARYLHQTSVPLLCVNMLLEFGIMALVTVLVVHLRDSFLREFSQSRVDYLTGAFNKRGFTEQMDGEMAKASRSGSPFSLAFIDLDHFKRVNDTQGHAAGDELLRTTASVLKSSLRRYDTVCRMGGDEFVLLLPETGPLAARVVVERIQQKFERRMAEAQQGVTMSLGCVTFVRVPSSIDTALGKGDEAMYQAKQQGKNRAVFVTATEGEAADLRAFPSRGERPLLDGAPGAETQLRYA